MPVPDLEITGGGGGGHPDPEIGGGAVSQNIFRLFGLQFGLRIRGRAGSPGPSPGSATANLCDVFYLQKVSFLFLSN